MRSTIHETFGNPVDVLHAAEAPLPEPKSGEVRIRMILSPIHNHDLWTVWGQYGYKPTLPAIGGTEAVGTIDALGPDVAGVTIGQRVAVASVHGTWAEYFTAPASGLVPVPEIISDESAAQLIAMPFSAISLLDFLNVNAGDWIVQNAANGAVGKTLSVLAKTRGVNIINLVRRDDTVAELSELGIDNVISTASSDWKDKVAALTNDIAPVAALDSIGGTASTDLIALLGENGTLVSFGSATGEPMQIPSGATIFKQITVKGFWGAKVSAAMAQDKRVALITELVTSVAKGELKLSVEAIYSLDQIAEAAAAAQKPGRQGKVLLRP